MSKKSTRKIKTSYQGEVLSDILDELNYVAGLLSLPPYAGPRHHFEARMARKEWEEMYGGERKKRRALKDLQRKKWLDARKRGNTVIVRISSDAVVASIKRTIVSTTKKLGDGIKCLLSYDFPVGSDKARKLWLHLIKSLGLKQEQQSLYSTEYDIGRELFALGKALGIENWIRVYHATEP